MSQNDSKGPGEVAPCQVDDQAYKTVEEEKTEDQWLLLLVCCVCQSTSYSNYGQLLGEELKLLARTNKKSSQEALWNYQHIKGESLIPRGQTLITGKTRNEGYNTILTCPSFPNQLATKASSYQVGPTKAATYSFSDALIPSCSCPSLIGDRIGREKTLHSSLSLWSSCFTPQHKR